MPLPALIPPLIAAGTDILGGVLQRSGELSARSTAYQTSVKDMRAAGLNPLLMMGSGGPASMPQMPNVVGNAVGSALQASQLRKQLEVLDAQAFSARSSGRKATTEALALMQDMQSPNATDPAGKSYRQLMSLAKIGLLNAQISDVSSAAALNRAGLPAARVMGGKTAGFWRALMGGGALPGAVSSAAKIMEVF